MTRKEWEEKIGKVIHIRINGVDDWVGGELRLIIELLDEGEVTETFVYDTES